MDSRLQSSGMTIDELNIKRGNRLRVFMVINFMHMPRVGTAVFADLPHRQTWK
ncbi:MAG: hypothetical protein WBD99_05745 [Thermodesulfobacteriota bacterium]